MTASVNTSDTEISIEHPADPIPHREQSCCARCCGFLWSDWTQVVGRLALVGGIATGGVGIYLQSSWVVAGGIAAVVAGYCFPDMRLSCTVPKKRFEENVDSIRTQNQQLSSEIERLTDNAQTLRNEVDKLIEFKKNANKTLRDLKQTNRETVQSLNEKIQQLSQLEGQLKTVTKLYLDLKNNTSRFAKDLIEYNKIHKVFKENLGSISGEMLELDKNEDDLSKEVKEANSLNVFYERQNKELQTLLRLMHAGIGNLENEFTVMRQGLLELSAHVSTLDLVDDKFVEGTKNLQVLIPEIKSILSDFNRNLETKKQVIPPVGGDELYHSLLENQPEKQ